MARIKFGSLVTEGHGSLGGTTFQNTGSGAIMRNKPINKKLPSASQSLIRSYNSKLQGGWRSLTDTQRDIWSRFAITHQIHNKSGDPHPLSGHSLFLKYNFEYISRGLALITVPFIMGPPYVGPELLLNGDFSSNLYWNFSAEVIWTGHSARFTGVSSKSFQQSHSISGGAKYRFSFDIINSDGSVKFFVQGSSTANLFPASNLYPFTLGDGSYSFDDYASDDSIYLRFSFNVAGGAFDIDNISLKQLFE